jgi:hypothetical protein
VTAISQQKGPRVPVICPSHRDLLEKPNPVAFATVGADGQPQVTAIWAMLDGDVVRASPYIRPARIVENG